MLGIDHGRAIAEERAGANHARIVGKDGDARFGVAMQESQDQLINERCLAGAAGPGEANDLCIFEFRFSIFDFLAGTLSAGVAVLDLREFSRELHVGGRTSSAFQLVRLSVALVNEIDHVRKRGAREENLIDSALLHHLLIVMGDGSAAAAKDRDVISAPFAK